jgi:hypothetical protein
MMISMDGSDSWISANTVKNAVLELTLDRICRQASALVTAVARAHFSARRVVYPDVQLGVWRAVIRLPRPRSTTSTVGVG